MRTVVAGNWKMHHGPGETRGFLEALLSGDLPEEPSLVIFPPSISIPEARRVLGHDSRIALGVQNVHEEPSGAFTGEVSTEMAAEAGATYALIGHSERRHVFGESDADTARKVPAALRAGLVPVLCVGETLEEREAARLEEVILHQLDSVLDAVEGELGDGKPLLLAYEPVWAIGTGRTATPTDAAEAHGMLRERLVGRLGPKPASDVPILYGGSVKPRNATDLLGASDVDGVLVGGASLDPESFTSIAKAAG